MDIFRKHHGVMRTSEALKNGISPRDLYAMRDQGIITQLVRGLYKLADSGVLNEPDWIIVAKIIPKAVIGFTSALAFYELTDFIPDRVSIALPRESEKPRISYPPLWIFWLNHKVYMNGINTITINTIQVRIYSIEKTIADCIKFRNRIGTDLAVDALKRYLARPGTDLNLLHHYANINRINRTLENYLSIIQ